MAGGVEACAGRMYSEFRLWRVSVAARGALLSLCGFLGRRLDSAALVALLGPEARLLVAELRRAGVVRVERVEEGWVLELADWPWLRARRKAAARMRRRRVALARAAKREGGEP